MDFLILLLEDHPGDNIIKFYAEKILKRFRKDTILTKAGCTPSKIVKAILSIRSDLSKQELKALISFCNTKENNMVRESTVSMLRMEVTILQGRNLRRNGESFTSYAQLKLENKARVLLAQRKTLYLSKRSDPRWNTTFGDFDSHILDHFEFLVVEVWNLHTAPKRKEFIGEAEITISEIRRGQLKHEDSVGKNDSENTGFKSWLKLKQNHKKKKWQRIQGEIQICIKYYLSFEDQVSDDNDVKSAPYDNDVKSAPSCDVAMDTFKKKVQLKREMTRRDAFGALDVSTRVRSRTQDFNHKTFFRKKKREKRLAPRRFKRTKASDKLLSKSSRLYA